MARGHHLNPALGPSRNRGLYFHMSPSLWSWLGQPTGKVTRLRIESQLSTADGDERPSGRPLWPGSSVPMAQRTKVITTLDWIKTISSWLLQACIIGADEYCLVNNFAARSKSPLYGEELRNHNCDLARFARAVGLYTCALHAAEHPMDLAASHQLHLSGEYTTYGADKQNCKRRRKHPLPS